MGALSYRLLDSDYKLAVRLFVPELVRERNIILRLTLNDTVRHITCANGSSLLKEAKVVNDSIINNKDH